MYVKVDVYGVIRKVTRQVGFGFDLGGRYTAGEKKQNMLNCSENI